MTPNTNASWAAALAEQVRAELDLPRGTLWVFGIARHLTAEATQDGRVAAEARLRARLGLD